MWYLGNCGAGRALAAESVAKFRTTGDRWGLALALQDLGQVVISAGEYAAARELYEEILTIYRDLGDDWGRGLPLLGLGRVALAEGDFDRARRLLEESRATFEAGKDPRLLAYALMRLGQLERSARNGAQATAWYRSALTAWERLGNRVGMALAVAGLAGAAMETNAERATLLGGAAAAQLDAAEGALTPLDRADYEPYLAAASHRLGSGRFVALWTEGTMMTAEAALALAMTDET